MSERESYRVHPGVWMVLLACWLVIGAAHAGRSILYHVYRPGYWLPEEAGIPGAIIDGAYDAGLWLVTSLAGYALAWRMEFDTRRWARSTALFGAAAVGLVMARFGLVELLAALTPLPGMGPVLDFLPYIPAQLVFSATAIGAGYALRYFVRLAEQESAAARLRAELAEARLQALRAQLHPHFLFNALNSVSALLHLDPAAAAQVLGRLRELLRMVLETGSADTVPLENEIALARAYLELEQVRFGDRLAVRIQVEPGAAELRVPPLILQPSVENAVRHGAAPAGRAVRVDVTAVLDPARGVLRLVVEDDGVGLEAAGGTRGTGIGIRNTRERLRHMFGAAHFVEVAPRPGGGTRVRIDVPPTVPAP